MEGLVRTLANDRLRWCILRGGSFVGPDTLQDNVVADQRSGKHVSAGTGQNFVSPIHVADMAAAIVAALEYGSDQSIFNIVDEPLREGEYLDRLADSIGAARPSRNAVLPTPPSWPLQQTRRAKFVSVVAKTTHKDGASSMPDGKPFTHDFGADLRKPYVIEDHTKDSSVGVFNHLIEEWQPVVLKLNVIIGERNGKFVYGVRHFYEDVEVYEPNHLGAAKEGASKGMVSAHAYFSRPVNTPVEILRAKVHAYGREPFDDPNGAHGVKPTHGVQ